MQTITKIMIVAIFLGSTLVGASAPAKAKYYRYYHHHLYWPGHYFQPYADTPGLTGLIHH